MQMCSLVQAIAWSQTLLVSVRETHSRGCTGLRMIFFFNFFLHQNQFYHIGRSTALFCWPPAICSVVRSCAKQLAAARGQQPPAASPEVNPKLLTNGRVVQPAETPEQSALVLHVLFLNIVDATTKHQGKGMI